MIKTVFFDLGGVVFRYDKAFITVAKKFCRKQEQFFELFDLYVNELTLGKMTSDQFWQQCQLDLKIKQTENFDFTRNWVKDFEAIDQTHELINTLSKELPVGYLSNIYHDLYNKAIMEKKLVPIERRMALLSCEINMQKPDLAIFKHAEKIAGFMGKEILFTDDNPEIVQAARNIGWQAVLFETNNPEKSTAEIRKKVSSS